jgi:TIR domain
MEYFLSHAGADKPMVKAVGAQLQLFGAEVFYDEWSIEAGESISGAIEDALDRFDVFLLFWSEAARESLWSRREYRAATKRVIEDETLSLIVLRLEDLAVPALVSDLLYVDALIDEDVAAAVNAVLGFKGPDGRIRALQASLDQLNIQVDYYPGFGPIVGCPRCGAGLEHMKPWHDWDKLRDDEYAGSPLHEVQVE